MDETIDGRAPMRTFPRRRIAAPPRANRQLDALVARVGAPQLATLAKNVPSPESFLYELKFDGYRFLAFKRGDDVRLVSRSATDWTGEFASIVRAVAALPTDEVVLDGEVCALDDNGVPSFARMQNRDEAAPRLVYFAFDALWADGDDLRGLPIERRRQRLRAIVAPVLGDGVIAFSSATEGDPRQILEVACRAGAEGIVAKRKGSLYVAGRQPTWLKVKCTLRQEFAVVGYVPLLKTRDAVGALLLALHEPDGTFRFAGSVGTGFDEKARVTLAKKLEALRSKAPTATGAPSFAQVERWAKPRLVAEVEFAEWTKDGLRHASFRGLRDDKKPSECVREFAEEE